MVIKRILRWFGIIVISICFGALAAIAPWICQALYIPLLHGGDGLTHYYSEATADDLAWIAFVWGTLLCVAIMTLGPRAKFNLFFAHGLAMLCLCLYLTYDFTDTVRQIHEPRRDWESIVVHPDSLLISLFVFIGLILLMFALIAAKDEDAHLRALRKKSRISISDEREPPLH